MKLHDYPFLTNKCTVVNDVLLSAHRLSVARWSCIFWSCIFHLVTLWSSIFQSVLHFPVLQIPPSDFWSCIFRSCIFHLVTFGPSFSSPAFSVSPKRGRKGGEGSWELCSSKNSFKSRGPRPTLTLRQIVAPVQDLVYAIYMQSGPYSVCTFSAFA